MRLSCNLSELLRPRLPVLLRRSAGVVANALLGSERKRGGVPVSIAWHDRFPIALSVVLDFVAGQALVPVWKRLKLALAAFLALQILAFLADCPLADLAGSHRHTDEGRVHVQRLQLGCGTVVDAQGVRLLSESSQSDGCEMHHSILARLCSFLSRYLELRAVRRHVLRPLFVAADVGRQVVCEGDGFVETVSEHHIESQPISAEEGAVRERLPGNLSTFLIAADEECREGCRCNLLSVTLVGDTVVVKADVARLEILRLLLRQHVVELIGDTFILRITGIKYYCDHREVVCEDGASSFRSVFDKTRITEASCTIVRHSNEHPIVQTSQLVVFAVKFSFPSALASVDHQIVVLFEGRGRIHVMYVQST